MVPSDLLSAAVENRDHVASLSLGKAPEHLLQRVHLCLIEHAVCAVVHHAVPCVIDEKQCIGSCLVIPENVHASLVDSSIELGVLGILQNLNLRLLEIQLAEARVNNPNILLRLWNVLKIFLAFDVAELIVLAAADHDGFSNVDLEEGRAWVAHEKLLNHSLC